MREPCADDCLWRPGSPTPREKEEEYDFCEAFMLPARQSRKMKFESVSRFFPRKRSGPFYCVCIIGLGILGWRIHFDWTAYRYGCTLTYRNVSKSGHDYLLHLPKGYTDFGEPRPLMIFLHGAGEVGKDVNVLRRLDPVHYAKGNLDAVDFPFIAVSPLTPKHGWEPRRVIELLDELLADTGKHWRIDETRIYLTGFSMGGFGTFRTACEFPERFAAIVPVAGGGESQRAERLKDVPTWAFHGDADEVVAHERSENMIEAMREAGCREAKLTTLEGAGHGITNPVYSNPELYRWMLEHKKRP